MYKNNFILPQRIIAFLTLIFILIVPIAASSVPSYPKLTDNVADNAGVLSESTIRSIKTANKSLKLDTGTIIAVCTVKTTGSVEIGEYARGLYKEAKLGEGVLILIASEDNNYYFVQSTGIENILTAEVLTDTRDRYFEEDFADGNMDYAVSKTVTKLKNFLTSEIKTPIKAGQTAGADSTDANADGTANSANGTADKPAKTVGSVIGGFFKTILYIALILIAAVAVFFVVSLFNDDAAALFRRYILRRKPAYRMPPEYYDERLYGKPQSRSGRQHPQNGANRPQRPRSGGYNDSYGYQDSHRPVRRNPQSGYADSGNRSGSPQNGNRRPANRQYSGQNQNRGYENRYVNNRGQQNNRGDYEMNETRAFDTSNLRR